MMSKINQTISIGARLNWPSRRAGNIVMVEPSHFSTALRPNQPANAPDRKEIEAPFMVLPPMPAILQVCGAHWYQWVIIAIDSQSIGRLIRAGKKPPGRIFFSKKWYEQGSHLRSSRCCPPTKQVSIRGNDGDLPGC